MEEVTGKGCIGIFGGSFSPPHMGHVLAAHYALLRWDLNKVLVVPSFKHPFGKYLPDFDKRLEMCQLAFGHLGPYVEVSDVERLMGGVSYTVDTVRELTRLFPKEQFRLLVGGDILPDTAKWREFDALLAMAPMLVIPRISDGEIQGGAHTEAALPEVDSTMIRRHIAEGGTPHGALPAQVIAYIIEHELYQVRDEDEEV